MPEVPPGGASCSYQVVPSLDAAWDGTCSCNAPLSITDVASALRRGCVPVSAVCWVMPATIPTDLESFLLQKFLTF